MKKYLRTLVFLCLISMNIFGQNEQEIAEKMLIGDHLFGVQFIWDGYGTCTIKKEEEAIKIEGSQFSNNKEDYVFIEGTIKIIDDRVFTVTGSIKTNIKDCCGKVEKEGVFTFKRWGNRKFWRLQNPERESLCDKYICHYYIDIFIKIPGKSLPKQTFSLRSGRRVGLPLSGLRTRSGNVPRRVRRSQNSAEFWVKRRGCRLQPASLFAANGYARKKRKE